MLEGEVVVTLDGAEHTARTGDTVFVPAGTWMAISNESEIPATIFGVIPRAEMETCMRYLYGAGAQEVSPERLDALCRLRSPENSQEDPPRARQ